MKISRKITTYIATAAIIFIVMLCIFFYFGMLPLVQHIKEVGDSLSTSEQLLIKDNDRVGTIFLTEFYLLLFLCCIFIILMFLLIKKKVSVPLTEAVEFSNKLANGQFPQKLASSHDYCDEIAALIKALNFMRDRMQNAMNKLQVGHRREKDARLEAEFSSTLKSSFLDNLTLELVSPLNSMSGFAQLAAEKIDKHASAEEIKKILQGITDNIIKLNLHINTLLEFSNFDNETIPHNSDFSTADFMNQLTTGIGGKVMIENYFSPDAPAVIRTDRNELFKILRAIFDAMLRFDSGAPIIACGCRKISNKLVFWITDKAWNEGQSSLAAVFKEYLTSYPQRIPDNTALPVLNLLIARRKAYILGAELMPIADEAAPCEFRLIFNLADIESERIPVASFHYASNLQKDYCGDGDAVDTEIPERFGTAAFSVFLAEPDKCSADLIKTFLEEDSFVIQSVASTDAAVVAKETRDGAFDLLILSMPPEDARDIDNVLNAIKEDEKLRSIPLIVLSYYISEQERKSIVQAGADCCLSKPLNFNQLRRVAFKLCLENITGR